MLKFLNWIVSTQSGLQVQKPQSISNILLKQLSFVHKKTKPARSLLELDGGQPLDRKVENEFIADSFQQLLEIKTADSSIQEYQSLAKSLKSRPCLKKRSRRCTRIPPRKRLLAEIAYEVDNAKFIVEQEEMGSKCFKCTVCSKEIVQRNSFEHGLLCYSKYERPLNTPNTKDLSIWFFVFPK